jgi:hypothetical protein
MPLRTAVSPPSAGLRAAVVKRLRTYKKEEVKRTFYGDSRILVLTLQGHPTLVQLRVLAQRVACRALLALAFPGEPSPLGLVPSQRLAELGVIIAWA